MSGQFGPIRALARVLTEPLADAPENDAPMPEIDRRQQTVEQRPEPIAS